MFEKRTHLSELSPELAVEVEQTSFAIKEYLVVLDFVVRDASRDRTGWPNHLLSHLAHDLLQSALSIPLLAHEGLRNVAKRELRFLVETSCKLCLVQEGPAIQLGDKLSAFAKELGSSNISAKRLKLSFFSPAMIKEFVIEVGRVYGYLSNYVHLSPSQISERIAASRAGRFAGDETPEDLQELNRWLVRSLACSLVLLLHSVDQHVAGDLLVEANGETAPLFFAASRFVAAIDEHFDYKHERQEKLIEIRAARFQAVRF